MEIPVHPDMSNQWEKIDSKHMTVSDYKTDPVVK